MEVVAEKVGAGEADEAEASDFDCLAHFLVASLECQLHKHGLLTGMKRGLLYWTVFVLDW